MTITPGYDFTINEVPTKAKFTAMLAGISLTAIDVVQISANLIGETIGDTSASMPLEGWLRVDPAGGIWVITASNVSEPAAQVKIDRANWGGWETLRFRCGVKTDTWPFPAGQTNFPINTRAQLSFATINDSNESNCVLSATVGGVTQMIAVKLLDTGVSGYRVRTLMRGAVPGLVTGNFTDHPQSINSNQTQGATNYTYVGFPITSIAPNAGLGLQRPVSGTGIRLNWLYGAYMAEQ